MTPKVARNGEVSFWFADTGGLPARRPALEGDTTADVCIIGAGFTGLWTAYYLRRADPSLRIVIIEQHFAGFGASGRNGGWLTGGFSWRRDRYLRRGGREGVRAMIRALAGTVDEVIDVAAAEGIDADIRRTDELIVATAPAQLTRARAEVNERQSWQVPEDRVRLLDAAQTTARVSIPGTLGAMLAQGVARIQPAKLVHGLAAAVERRGVVIAEGTRVTGFGPGRVHTTHGTVHAGAVLRATEGFTAALPHMQRNLLALNSAQIVTEPLSAAIWGAIGWQGHEIVGDFANIYCYCQRTRDGRIAIGGRGVPYLYGSGLDTDGRTDKVTIARLVATLHRHFPQTKGARIDHAWCGVLGVPRDWCARVMFDKATGSGWAGGYVGVGVSTANLAGRTLADLVTGTDSALVRLPWVNLDVRRWEPEPLRWLGIHGMYALMAAADRNESRGIERTSPLLKLAHRLTGR